MTLIEQKFETLLKEWDEKNNFEKGVLIEYRSQFSHWIFSHDFAKACFGEELIPDLIHSYNPSVPRYLLALQDLAMLPTTEERMQYYLDHAKL